MQPFSVRFSWCKRLFVLAAMLTLSGCVTTTNTFNQLYSPSTADLAEEKEKKAPKLIDQSAEELLDRGFQHLAAGNHQLAQLHFLTALEKDPLLPRAFAGIGQSYMAQGNKGNAISAFTTALQQLPDDLASLIGLGHLHRETGDLKKSAEYLQKALAISPDAVVMTELAITHDALGETSAAEALYNRVAELEPATPSAHNNLGFNYLLQGKYQQAVDAFNHTLELQPGDKRARNNLAVAFAMQGQEELAVQIMEGTVGKAAAYNNLGYMYMSRGMHDQAERAFEKSIQLKPSLYVRAKENLNALRIRRAEEKSGLPGTTEDLLDAEPPGIDRQP